MAIEYRGAPSRLNDLRTAVAVNVVTTFEVPRPKALLGQEHLDRLIALTRAITTIPGQPPFETFHLSAAGADTPVFQRLTSEIASRTGLASNLSQGDLAIAIRRAPTGLAGWQVLIRLTPRPLSARPWRVCNMPGALNATVARIMVDLASPSANERFLNLAAGSGTLLVERLLSGPARRAVGIDISEEALRCARLNLAAAGVAERVELIRADARQIPLASGSFDTIVADLPFGMLVGSPRQHDRLYPEILAEAARLAATGARGVMITTRAAVIEAALRDLTADWQLERAIPLKLSYQSGYIQPTLYVLRRTNTLKGDEFPRSAPPREPSSHRDDHAHSTFCPNPPT